MNRLTPLLLALAAGLAGPARAHPGHHPGEPAPPPRAAGAPAETLTPAARLAESLIERGQAGLAARLVARDAVRSADAARVLAAALEELGDPVGARIARERAAALGD